MRAINFKTEMEESELNYTCSHLPDSGYLEGFLSPSEPRILFFTHYLGNSKRMFNALRDHGSLYGVDIVDILPSLDERAKRLERLSGKRRRDEEKELRKDIKSLPTKCTFELFGKFRDGDAFELPIDNPDEDLSALVSLHYVRLPWDKVRLQVCEGQRQKGYFICFGWSPIFNQLYYAGPDFVPKRTAEENAARLANVPEGRGLPDDVLQTLANCGPSSLAAYLNISSRKVIEQAYTWQETGWISIKPMLELLEDFGKIHKSVKVKGEHQLPGEAFGDEPAGLAFIQFTGPTNKKQYSGWGAWSQAYSHTHWIAFDKGLVYDINARHVDKTLGDWIPEKEWIDKIVPLLMLGKRKGHYVKNILIPKTV